MTLGCFAVVPVLCEYGESKKKLIETEVVELKQTQNVLLMFEHHGYLCTLLLLNSFFITTVKGYAFFFEKSAPTLNLSNQ